MGQTEEYQLIELEMELEEEEALQSNLLPFHNADQSTVKRETREFVTLRLARLHMEYEITRDSIIHYDIDSLKTNIEYIIDACQDHIELIKLKRESNLLSQAEAQLCTDYCNDTVTNTQFLFKNTPRFKGMSLNLKFRIQ
jgi:hypothetical protein